MFHYAYFRFFILYFITVLINLYLLVLIFPYLYYSSQSRHVVFNINKRVTDSLIDQFSSLTVAIVYNIYDNEIDSYTF